MFQEEVEKGENCSLDRGRKVEERGDEKANPRAFSPLCPLRRRVPSPPWKRREPVRAITKNWTGSIPVQPMQC